MEPLEDSTFRPLGSARLLEVLVVEPEGGRLFYDRVQWGL